MAAGAFTFGPFRLDARTKELQRGGVPVAIGVRDADLLLLLVARAGTLLSRDEIVHLVWSDAAVTDNSVEQAISNLRRLLDGPAGQRCIRTERGRGYRFVAPVEHTLHRESDAAIDALLAPHRAWLDGRRALETLEGAEIRRALEIFTHVIEDVPAQASAHVGLANACVLQFETTRADAVPDREALDRAVTHAREACRLDPEYGEAWATLGFVLERAGRRPDALAALRRAVMLEPDNWRHHLRLAYA
ncbi:MAG: winged helix-turn-helix domain-containing protein, partial [Vicinamibacterales bacterium]